MANQQQVTNDSIPPILRLPDELLQTVFTYLRPRSAAAAGATCSQLYKIATEPLLWRFYCQSTWRFWTNKSTHERDLHLLANEVPWRQKYIDRHTRDAHNAALFDSLLSQQQNRHAKMQTITESRDNAKELLMEYTHAPVDAEDVLARRYWAQMALRQLHRTRALDIWWSPDTEDGPDLVTRLVAFDLFLLGRGEGDPTDVASKLDEIAQAIRLENPDMEYLELQPKAVLIADYLRRHRWVGNPDSNRYHDMHNNFLSLALFTEPHTSLPLQSAAIYCAVAQRLSIQASPCNYPTHVYVVVPLQQASQPSEGSAVASDPSEDRVIIMDPWRQSTAVDRSFITRQLNQTGIPESQHHIYLQPSTGMQMVERALRNLMTSLNREHEQGLTPRVDCDIDDGTATYLYGWIHWIRQQMVHEIFVSFMHYFKDQYAEDVDMFQRYTLATLAEWGSAATSLAQNWNRNINETRAADTNARPIVRRDKKMDTVRFKVGQIFQHKRYGYTAVIIGWDKKCEAGEGWIAHMNVDALGAGRTQSFYHVLGEDKSKRYVAEENIHPVYEEPSKALMDLAGRYFKRWDQDTRTFASNIRDEYPDD